MYPSTFAHLHDAYALPTGDVARSRKHRAGWRRRRARVPAPSASSRPASAAPTSDPIAARS